MKTWSMLTPRREKYRRILILRLLQSGVVDICFRSFTLQPSKKRNELDRRRGCEAEFKLSTSSNRHSVKFLHSRKRTSWTTVIRDDYVIECISHRLANMLGFTVTLIWHSRTHISTAFPPRFAIAKDDERAYAHVDGAHAAQANLQNFMHRFTSCST